MFDTIITNARIVDGSGAPWFGADLAVADGKIAVIGELSAQEAERVVDAGGKVLCPGFIEIHGHSDATLLINPLAESSIHLGVTTECTGNCGSSLFPVNSRTAEMIRNHFTAFVPDYEINWSDLAQLKDAYESQGVSVNIVPLIGHNVVRAAVKGSDMGPSTPDERRRMAVLVEEGMAQGARGFSTGLEYPPGSAADLEELVALTAPLAKYRGLYATHIRNRDLRYLDAIREALTIGRRCGAAVQISHNVAKIGAPDGIMSSVLSEIEEARSQGLDVAFDVGAYLGGQTTPLGTLPPWAFDGGPAKTLERLADPAVRQKMKAYEYPIWRIVKMGRWDKVWLASSSANADLVGNTFAQISREQGKDPYDTLFDLLLDEGGGFFELMWEGEIYHPEDRDLVLKHPWSSICCDGRTLAPYGPLSKRDYHHVYTWTAYVLRHHVRERGFLSLEEAIHKMTGSSANRLGLFDRGLVREGLAADLVLFDPAGICDRATLKDPHVYPEGIDSVWVNGELTLDRGRHTGRTPGRVLTW